MDGAAFMEPAGDDRHQFRLIVSAEDGAEYEDLRPLIRRFMARMEEDLGTGLYWAAVDHLDTGYPHTHIIVRGRDDRGENLVISPEYIAHCMRERLAELVTLDLGPRTDSTSSGRSAATCRPSGSPVSTPGSCPQRIFLPNERAVEPPARAAYEKFGLNERQIELIARATPKRDYYLQSRRGNRLFDLGLGRIALAFCGASDADAQRRIDRLLADHGSAVFARRWLEERGLDWASAALDRFQSPTSERGDLR